MGGCCCCASKSTELRRSPPFLHQYPVSEEHEPLSSHHATVSVLSAGLLLDTNLDTSIADSYCPPPAPVPHERCLRCPPAPSENQENSESKTEAVPQITNTEKNLEFEEKPKEVEDEKSGELKKSIELFVPPLQQEEEDFCPTCFEEYDVENPKIITRCKHHFHLSCILEWMERSDTCPVCDKEMVFGSSVGE